MEWFYEKNGAQQGPVAEDELKRLVGAGDVNPRNLVWREGMADWSPYATVFADPVAAGATDCPTCGASVDSEQLIPAGDRQVCPNCRDSYAQGLKEGVTHNARFSSGRGTGGMTPNGELRAMAKETLSGQWGGGVVITLVFTVIQSVVGFIPFIGGLIQWAITGPMTIGFNRAFLAMYRGDTPDSGLIFSAFDKFWRGFGLYFMVSLIIGLGALAAAIPGGILAIIIISGDSGAYATPEENPLFILGIVCAVIPAVVVSIYLYLRYALTYYLATDYPEMGVFDLIEESKRKMDGHKKKLFWLYLSFIPYHFLGCIALFIGLLWSMTFMYTGIAAFYDDLGEES